MSKPVTPDMYCLQATGTQQADEWKCAAVNQRQVSSQQLPAPSCTPEEAGQGRWALRVYLEVWLLLDVLCDYTPHRCDRVLQGHHHGALLHLQPSEVLRKCTAIRGPAYTCCGQQDCWYMNSEHVTPQSHWQTCTEVQRLCMCSCLSSA